MRTIAVLHHVHKEIGDNLWKDWRVVTWNIWEALRAIMNIWCSTDIILASSPTPQTLQVAKSIQEGLWLSEVLFPMHVTEYLWKDDHYKWDIQKALEFLSSLPDSLFLIVVTHSFLLDELSRWLWRTEKTPQKVFVNFTDGILNLGWSVFSLKKEKKENSSSLSISQITQWKNSSFSLEETQIPLTKEQTAFQVLEILTQLQKLENTWQILTLKNGTKRQYLVPIIRYSDDLWYSALWEYDTHKRFPVSIYYTENPYRVKQRHPWIQEMTQSHALQVLLWIIDDIAF